jgi:hypothetical protein
MRSRWFDWRNNAQLVEKGGQSEPTEPTKPGSVGSVGPSPTVFQIDHGGQQGETWWEELALGEARGDHEYRDRLQAAFLLICPDYTAGMVDWLEGADPVLYDDLICRLPRLISQQWNIDSPIEDFQQLVDMWLATHQRACALFRERTGKDASQGHQRGKSPATA